MEEMKNCPKCGAVLTENEKSCPYCGSVMTEEAPSVGTVPEQTAQEQIEYREPIPEKKDNVIAGIVGALLFGLGGAALYFGIYQIGIIAGICGLVIFVLANFGYGIFCGNKDSVSITRIVVSIAVTIIMILFAEYICVAFELFRGLKDYGESVSFIDCLRSIPAFLGEKEVMGAVLKDILFAIGLSAIAVISTVARMLRERKAKLNGK